MTKIHSLFLLVFAAFSVAACTGGDSFDDPTIGRTIINGWDVARIRAELRPGYSVTVALNDGEELRLIVQEVGEENLVGSNNEAISFDEINYVEFISDSDRSFSGRLEQVVLMLFAALAAVIMGAAALMSFIIEAARELF